MWRIATAILTTLVAANAMASPADDVRAAAANAEKLPTAQAYAARYLSLAGCSPATTAAVNYSLNALSRVRQITRAVQINPTLLRIDCGNYVNDASELRKWELEWATIAESDPYYAIPTQVLGADGKPQRTTVAGGWTDLAANARLRRATYTPGYGAILRADFFVNQSLNPQHYYAFAGLPDNQTALLTQLGINQQVIDKLEADMGANLLISNFTDKPRGIAWTPGPLGGIYATQDTATVDAAHDKVRRPITDGQGHAAAFDAGEFFFRTRNGLWGVYIANNQGQRLDAVQSSIAVDNNAIDDHLPDRSVVAGHSCLICHAPEQGLNSFNDSEWEQLHPKAGAVSLYSYDPALVRKTIEFYDEPRLQKQVAFDRDGFEDACRRTCGLSSAEAGAAIRRVYRDYNLPVRAETLAAENGITVPEIPAIIGTTHDEILAAIAEGHSVPRGSYESSAAEFETKLELWRRRN